MNPSAAPDPNIAWNVVLTIGVLLNLIVAGFAVSRGNKRQVTIVADAVTKAEFEKHVTENIKDRDQLFANISGKERGLRADADKAVGELRTQLMATNSTMHELKGEMKQLSIQLVAVQQELANR